MIYKGQKLSDNLTKSQRDMFKYYIDRRLHDGATNDFTLSRTRRGRMIWIIGLLTIITVILGFIAVMIWAIGDRLSQK